MRSSSLGGLGLAAEPSGGGEIDASIRKILGLPKCKANSGLRRDGQMLRHVIVEGGAR